MKCRVLLAFALLSLSHLMTSNVAQADMPTMRYVHISGQFTKVGQDQVIADLKTTLLDQIDGQLKHLTRSYAYTVDGASRVNLSLVAQATDATGEAFLSAFVAGFDQAGFEGVSFKFQAVSQIVEHVDFLAGKHVVGSADDAFKADSEILREYNLSSLQEWTRFMDRIGEALQSHVHANFMDYIAWFIGDAPSYKTYVETVFDHDDLVYADLIPTLQFADGTFSSPNASPFFDMPFARNCWDAGFENGSCQGGTSALR